MHPFFEPSKLSDEELRDKLSELQTRYYASHAMGLSFEIKDQIQSFIGEIEFEMQSRQALIMQKAWDAMFPDVIESEPDLKPDAAAKKAAAEGPKKKEGQRERPANAPQFNKVYKQ